MVYFLYSRRNSLIDLSGVLRDLSDIYHDLLYILQEKLTNRSFRSFQRLLRYTMVYFIYSRRNSLIDLSGAVSETSQIYPDLLYILCRRSLIDLPGVLDPMDDASVLNTSGGATPATTRDTERLPQTCL